METSKSFVSFKSVVIIAIIVVFLYGIYSKKKDDNVVLPSKGRYSLPWRTPTRKELVDISKALIKGKIRGCGKYYIRESLSDDGEYLIACTGDGNHWSYYLVWTPSGKVMGPISDTFSKPR